MKKIINIPPDFGGNHRLRALEQDQQIFLAIQFNPMNTGERPTQNPQESGIVK